MEWTREVFGTGNCRKTYTSGEYTIRYERILSSKSRYSLNLNGRYLCMTHSLDFAKKNAERHLRTGTLIGGYRPTVVGI